ncbi:MAG TPA: DUF1800 domain-containing protein [Actinomycetota bacterium]
MRTATAASVLAGSGVATGLLSASPAMAAGSFVPTDPDLHLLRRATWGITPQLQKDIRQMGRNKWLDKQLDPGSINDAFVEDFLEERMPNLTMGVKEAYDFYQGSWDLMYDLTKAAILRAAWSKRQLFEVMVDFWSNHLNIANPHEACWWSRHDYDRTVIRKHAFGKFSNMLRGSVLHPAMMAYLNNASSTRDNPNENYGREILELHSVGVDGGYNEEDMRQSTLILTGFGFDWETGKFAYHPWDHYTGPIDVMGFHANNNDEDKGYDAALKYVDYLAHHRSTAERIATKLIQRFVQDVPPPGLVDTLADTYMHHDTAIKPVLQKLFDSSAFKHSTGKKVRRPFQDVTATIRTLGIGIKRNDEGEDALQQLSWVIEGLGDLPLAWIPPNGYPDYADAWRSAGITLGRWNLHLGMPQGWWPNALEIPEDWVPRLLGKKLPKTWGGVVDALSQRLVFRKLSTEHRAAVLAFVGKASGEDVNPDDQWLADWRFPYLMALFLDSPYHGIR